MRTQARTTCAPAAAALTLALACAWPLPAVGESAAEPDALELLPFELRLLDGDLRILNLYKKQALILRELEGAGGDELAARMLAEVYRPHAAFWAKYCCKNEETFAHVVRMTRGDLASRVEERLPELMRLDLNTLFETAAGRLEQMTGRRPRGTWHLVFSLGMTDLGGVGGGDMIIDFTHPETEPADLVLLMPHELTHQIQGVARRDAGPGTVLDRVLSEGFASYVGYRYFGEKHTPAENLLYEESEWEWALANEKAIFQHAREYFESTDKEDEHLFGSRDAQVMEGGPGALGYFIGFRIVQAYVATHGSDSWLQLFDMPAHSILEKSGYDP